MVIFYGYIITMVLQLIIDLIEIDYFIINDITLN